MSAPIRTPYTTAEVLFWWSAEHQTPRLDVASRQVDPREDYILRIKAGRTTARIWAERPSDALALAGELERCARELRDHVAGDTGTTP